MSEYRISISAADGKPFVLLETRYTEAASERTAKKESRLYSSSTVLLEKIAHENGGEITKVYYRNGRMIRR